MNPTERRKAVTRAVAVLAATGLTGILLWYLPKPGFGASRLVLFAVLVGAAWTGAAGVPLERPPVTVAGAGVLVLLGFWQAALWVWIVPTALLLLGAAALAPQPATEKPAAS